MRNKNSKKVSFYIGNVEKDFTEERISLYSGISSVSDYVQPFGVGQIDKLLFSDHTAQCNGIQHGADIVFRQ